LHTEQISQTVLTNYIHDRLSSERIEMLTTQAKEQIEEIRTDQTLYEQFLQKTGAPKEIDTRVLWVAMMCDDDICSEYISRFKKPFADRIPVSDLADLIVYLIHTQKSKEDEIAGYDFLMAYEKGDIDDVDQYAFTNVLLYIQQSKEGDLCFSPSL